MPGQPKEKPVIEQYEPGNLFRDPQLPSATGFKFWLDQIIVVDGGSTDGTIEWAKANGDDVHVQKQREGFAMPTQRSGHRNRRRRHHLRVPTETRCLN